MRVCLSQCAARSRRPRNTPLSICRLTEDLVKSGQNATPVALKKIGLRLHLPTRILPDIIVNASILIIERVTFNIVGAVIRIRLITETAIFGRCVVLVIGAAFRIVRLQCIFVHIEYKRFDAQARTLLGGLVCPVYTTYVVCMRPICQANNRSAPLRISRSGRGV